MPRLKAAHVMLSLATAFVPATLAAQTTNGAVPGSISFVQGQANIDGQPINKDNTATQPRQLHAGETLATANGSADILLAPGALLRIGEDSTVKMVNAAPNRTEVRLEQGRANISVNTVRHDDLLLVDMQNGQTQVLSRGLYTFNTATNTMRVFNGEAEAFPDTSTDTDVKPVKVKEGHEVMLTGERAKAEKFDREMADGDLLPWTGPKESQAMLADRGVMYGNGPSYTGAAYYGGGEGFYGPAGFGDPYYAGVDPYGWGPYGFWGYPFFGVGFGYWGGGFYGGGYPIHGPIHFPGPVRSGYAGGVHSSFAGRGFAGGAGRGFAGGGFHGGGGFGGGGFHGGGGGGHR